MDTLSRLVYVFNNTQPGDAYHDVAGAFLKNYLKFLDINVQEAADLCFSSVATVNRFVKYIGYLNFGDFKSNLVNNIYAYTKSNRRMPLVRLGEGESYTGKYLSLFRKKLDEIEQSIDGQYLRSISEAIHASKFVGLISSSPYEFPAFQLDLIMNGKETMYVDNFMSRVTFKPDSLNPDCMLIFIIPRERETLRTYAGIEAAKTAGAKILVIVRGDMNLYEKFADFVLNYESTDSGLDDYVLSIIMNILIIDYRNNFVDTQQKLKIRSPSFPNPN